MLICLNNRVFLTEIQTPAATPTGNNSNNMFPGNSGFMNNSQIKNGNQNSFMNNNGSFMGNSNRGPAQQQQTAANFGMNQMNMFGQNVIKKII